MGAIHAALGRRQHRAIIESAGFRQGCHAIPRVLAEIAFEPSGPDHPSAGEFSLASGTVLPPLGCIVSFVLFGCHTGRPEAAWRRAASSAIAEISPPKRCDISRRMRCISSIGDSGVDFCIIAQQLLGSTHDREWNVHFSQDLMDPTQNPCVRNMPAIPRQ